MRRRRIPRNPGGRVRAGNIRRANLPFLHLFGIGSESGYFLASIRASGGRVRIAPNSSAAPANPNSGR